MKKKLLALFLVLAMLCPILLIPAYADTTVYITKTGEKYHNAGCGYLSESCIEVSLDYAVSQGLTPCSKCNAPASKPSHTFVDIHNDKYYYEPVLWAYGSDPQITSGMDKTHFQPDSTCTRGQIVTFLWRANGCPEPTAKKCPFKDVKSSDYYYTAVLWAVENDITNGIDKTHFAPASGCTRGQVVTFLWRADGQPKPSSSKCPFKDVATKSYYYTAVLWAVGENITTGMSANRFAPDTTCTRGQIVTFLYRDFHKTAKPDTPAPKPQSDASGLEVFFLNVGQGDATVIRCGGKTMLIDGGSKSSSNLIYSFLKSHNITHLDYIIASHPDADHIGGLSGALNYASVGKAFCTTTQHDTETFNDFVKYLSSQNVNITVPDAGDKFTLGNASFTVLYPHKGSSKSGNTSLVIRIQYGETSFLFTGDCETEDENVLLDAGYSVKSTVLKVAHHGSDSSTSYRFLYSVNPQYAVISVGKNNSYGHPSNEVLSRLRDADVTTFRTDMQGDIHCVSDGKAVTFDVQKNPNIDTLS